MVQNLCGEYRERLRHISFTPYPERYMAAVDIFCLPSHREGFGQVIIEAGACGVPTIASHIYGITDAVEDGKTGVLFPPGNSTLLTQYILKLVEDPELRNSMGKAARIRAQELFSSQKITGGMLAIYSELLDKI
jgi:glycosyltransferase involved in cell wall biosynthesis